MKFSVIVTTFNEAESIVALLDSLAAQTLQPTEVVIVDAGSTDDTAMQIEKWLIINGSFPVKLEIKKRFNRSKGRNLAIQLAKEEWIAVTDGGCVADERWLEEISFQVSRQFGGQAGFRFQEGCVVAGFYETQPKSALGQVFAWYLAVQPEDLDEASFLPSSRSIAFTKEAWEGVGGYPEELDTCEDLVFARRLKEKYGLVVAREAIMYWRLPETLADYFVRVSGYARGDVQAGYQPHLRKIGLVFARYVAFLFWPELWLLYLLVWPLGKFYKKVSEVSEDRGELRESNETSPAMYKLQLLLLLPVVQVVSDVAVMCGAVMGLFKMSRKR